MIVGKWNYEKHDYDPYIIPNNWRVVTYCVNDKEIINCASCGKQMIVDDGYVSMEIHTSIGIGYVVCEECYNKEWERRKKYKNEED